MSTDLRFGGAFALALLATAALVPVAIYVARRTGFLDRPGGWKTHLQPTPVLGGSAVVAGIVFAVAAFAGDLDRIWPILAGILVLSVTGMIDDRVQLPASPRVIIEGAVGAGLWAADLGWALPIPDLANLALTMVWVVGVINALNYLDLMDGVATATAIAIALPAAALAGIEGDHALAVCALAVAGAGCAFLPFNLASPPRTFLGDGGTMPIGLVLAAVIMGPASQAGATWPALIGGACLVGVPLLDMAFRLGLRLREHRPLIPSVHDSAASRLGPKLPGPGWVALLFGSAQLIAGACTVAALEAGNAAVALDFSLLFLGGLVAAALIHLRPSLRPVTGATLAEARPDPAATPDPSLWPPDPRPAQPARRHAG